MGTVWFSQLAVSLFLAVLLGGALSPVGCLTFNFSTFQHNYPQELLMSNNSRIFLNAIQVTPDSKGLKDLKDNSGRVFYKTQFRLKSKSKGVTAAFNTTFKLNIQSQTSPGGEGMAFILAADTALPEASYGQWLGIVNATTNGSSQANVVAVEFDTRKSYPEDLDDNHVGLNVNSIYSIKRVSLEDYGVNLSSALDVEARVQYDGTNISVFVSMTNGARQGMPVLSLPLNLSQYLPEKVFVGFSASTSDYTELNCVKSWEFHGEDVGDEKPELLWIWITVPAVLVLFGIVFYLYLQRNHREQPEDAYPRIEDQIKGSSVAPRRFRLKELRKATGNFNLKNKLGRGGFGTVYKGFLENKEVAVKRVSKDSTHGKQEFIAEVATIGNLHHKNLVKLIGWCYEKRDFLLVYEFMPNSSLDKFIFDYEKLGNEELPTLGWEKRRIIVYGVAEALDYLHNGCEKRVLHRDIKASNIMLDSDFNAKLGDFGLARIVQQRGKDHHTTKEIAGTPGYMAPETFLISRATVETDIYAFGVLVLEVVCGRKPGNQNEDNDYNNGIVNGLWELHRRERILDAVDSRLAGEFDEQGMVRMLVLGLACCHPNPHHRPSMKTVLQVLTGEAPLPPVPIERPSFVWPAMPPSFKQDPDISLIGGQLSPFTQLTGR
ncbi:probable L-type lectin-domain containing receptor kinase S.5 [Juglans microcarpa x Juglans regia]|uniref:probable L-type lectin-domain containing receptor kinase S.5 n=1 Tax=Juglans microcarpa x Juglans regia TaxID=2249226 RepID=UPI001B7E9F27|nr:probable L-type lectin-domain containing receptor kinase S.5 [Juglans microcarpa x Juglans regia]